MENKIKGRIKKILFSREIAGSLIAIYFLHIEACGMQSKAPQNNNFLL
jgi:hypothetical protein